MDREEQQLIEDLFARLRSFGGSGPKDPDAEALIADLMRRSPDAPYYLAQTAIIQQEALSRAETRMRELEEAAARPQQYGLGRGGSFLSGSSVPSAGGGRYSSAPSQRDPEPVVPPPTSPWSAAPQRGGGAGGFLSSALTTAAGVAGGVFLADGIRGLFGGGNSAYAGGTNSNDQATIDRLQDEAQDARDDADKDKKDLAADDAELDQMQDAQDDDDDDTWTDDDSMDV
jgi:hypothetical protein